MKSVKARCDGRFRFVNLLYSLLYFGFFCLFSTVRFVHSVPSCKVKKAPKIGTFWIFSAFLDFSGFWISRTVNRRVVSSSLTWGAKEKRPSSDGRFSFSCTLAYNPRVTAAAQNLRRAERTLCGMQRGGSAKRLLCYEASAESFIGSVRRASALPKSVSAFLTRLLRYSF